MNSQQPTLAPRLFGMITTAASMPYTIEAIKTFFLYTNFREIDAFILIDNDGAWTQNKPLDHPAVNVELNAAPYSFAVNANFFIKLAINKKQDLFILNNDLIFNRLKIIRLS